MSNEREAYKLALEGADKLLRNCGSPPVNKKNRVYVVTRLEVILFHGKDIPLEFRELSDLYIARGIESLYSSKNKMTIADFKERFSGFQFLTYQPCEFTRNN